MPSKQEKADAAAAAKYGDDIHQAAMHGDMPALRHFLRVAPERVHEKFSSDGSTPLHGAVANGRVAAAELFLSKGAAVDARANDGDTPLQYAARGGHVEAAELLLSKGAVVDAKNDNGQTPLYRAARLGKVEAAELLLSKGAAVDCKDNDGKTPLDVVTLLTLRKTEMVQLLLNPPAKKASADDGKTPEKESLPTAADKTSKAGKKAQQTPGFAFSSPRRQTSKEDPSSPAGSGAAAAKHQREASKEEAAKELQEAMNSGDAQVLMNAIDNAKWHKVNQEVVMKAMEKCIALQGAVHQSAKTPAKEATTSKAENSVKLEPGHGARLAMISARFNEKNKDTENKFRAVRKLLIENHYEILMVEAGGGENFGNMTAEYLNRLESENGVMLAVCTSDYGEKTDSTYCTYYELQYAKEYNLDVLPLQVEDQWKPNPPCHPDRDPKKSALGFIKMVFLNGIVRVDCRNKSIEEIASAIAAVLKRKPEA